MTWVSRPMLSPVFLWQLVSSICQFQSLSKGSTGPHSGPFSHLNLIWRVDGSLTDWSGPSPHYFLLSLCKELWKTVPCKSVTRFVCEFLEHTSVVFSLLSEPWAEGSSNSNGNSSLNSHVGGVGSLSQWRYRL